MGIPLQPVNIHAAPTPNPMMTALQISQGLSSMQDRRKNLQLQQQQQAYQQQLAQQKLALAQQQLKAHQPLWQAQTSATQARVPLLQAQTSAAQRQQAYPGLGRGGLPGQYSQLEYLRNVKGENSPEYQQYLQAIQRQQHAQDIQNQYRQNLAKTLEVRSMPTDVKKQAYQVLQTHGVPIVAPIPLGLQGSATTSQQSQQKMPVSQGALQTSGVPQAQTRGATLALSPQEQKEIAAQQAEQTKTSLDKSLMGADQQKRLQAANRVRPLLESMAKDAPSAFEYASLSGQAKKALAVANAQTGVIDPRYLAYLTYQQNEKGAMLDAALALGVHPTDKGFENYAPMFNIAGWKSNPKLAANLFNNLAKQINVESKKNAQLLSQTRTDVQGRSPVRIASGLQGGTQITSPVKMPTFQTRDDAKKWFLSLTPEQQAQVEKGIK